MNENRGKILWIDDEIDHLKPHILFLQEKGYEITTSSNGKDGIDKVSSHSFDLILVDQFMPGIDGMETVEKIKIRLWGFSQHLRPLGVVVMEFNILGKG